MIARDALALGLCLLAATATLAHEGVKNPAVMDRMNGMSRIAEATKVLRTMTRGTTPFDAEAAQAATIDIAREARQIVALFEAPETDPKSEALPIIWDDFDTFSSYAGDLVTAAEAARGLTSPGDLQQAFERINDSCAACHDRFAK